MHPTRAPRLLAIVLLAASLAGCAAPGGDSPEPVRTDHVRMADGWAFEPQVIEVTVNTTVTWTNDDSLPHTVTFDGFDERLAPGEQVNHTFTEVGEFSYKCEFHTPDMVGKVIVVPAEGGQGNGTEK